jgi:CMP-N-acetylneuraminic acid synthetase
MINNKTILALIPARGGSKGLPGKNIKPLLGKPLVAWTIEQAKNPKKLNLINRRINNA